MAKRQTNDGEEKRGRSVRLPKWLWNVLGKVSEKEHRPINWQIQLILEQWLTEKGYLKEDNRKR